MRQTKIRIILAALTLASGLLFARGADADQPDVLDLVNPFLGTDQSEHAFPGATWPFGMVQLSPDTGGNKGLYLRSDWNWCAGYHWADSSILGFSHLHRSGMGVGEWGDILVMPTTGKLRLAPGEPDRPRSGYRSAFRHETETARPGYYRVTLDDSNITAELTVGPRSGFHRYTFPAADSHLIIDLARGLGDLPLLSSLRFVGHDRIVGTRASTGLITYHKVHFCAAFSRPFDDFGAWNGPARLPGARAVAGDRIGAWVDYHTRAGDTVLVKVGISFTSEDEACKNLAADQPGWDFDAAVTRAGDEWRRELSLVRVEPAAADDPALSRRRLRVFYTGLYHSLLFPALFSDADGSYSVEGNVPGINKTAKGFDYYSEFSVWDTFRAEMPLLMLIERKRATDMVRTMLRQYEDSGWLPSPNQFGNYHSEGMIGDPAAIVIYDAMLKGLSFERSLAYWALRKNATAPAVNLIPMIGAGAGRFGIMPYQALGYIPADFVLPPKHPLFIAAYAFNQGVSRTLEYAYADFCLAGLARATGRVKDAEYFTRRSDNWRNIFDPATGFMRGKSVTGRWMNQKDYNPAAYYGYYTEGNGWQWTWNVFHDVPGLIAAMGGRDKFNAKLDAFFNAGSEVEAYDLFSVHIGGQIGQYAHGNEPSHHIAYLYDFSGQPWKTQALARRIMDEMYADAPHGLAGNEDMGQMSAWYIFSSLGLYPFAAGIYTIGSPLWQSGELDLGGGKRLRIEAENVSATNQYVQSVTLNGAPLSRPWLRHDEIGHGGTIRFVMGAEPNLAWGTGEASVPRVK